MLEPYSDYLSTVHMHWMTYFARQHPEQSCEVLLQKHEWQALDCKINRKAEPAKTAQNLKVAIMRCTWWLFE